jgi:hypothetical protein
VADLTQTDAQRTTGSDSAGAVTRESLVLRSPSGLLCTDNIVNIEFLVPRAERILRTDKIPLAAVEAITAILGTDFCSGLTEEIVTLVDDTLDNLPVADDLRLRNLLSSTPQNSEITLPGLGMIITLTYLAVIDHALLEELSDSTIQFEDAEKKSLAKLIPEKFETDPVLMQLMLPLFDAAPTHFGALQLLRGILAVPLQTLSSDDPPLTPFKQLIKSLAETAKIELRREDYPMQALPIRLAKQLMATCIAAAKSGPQDASFDHLILPHANTKLANHPNSDQLAFLKLLLAKVEAFKGSAQSSANEIVQKEQNERTRVEIISKNKQIFTEFEENSQPVHPDLEGLIRECFQEEPRLQNEALTSLEEFLSCDPLLTAEDLKFIIKFTPYSLTAQTSDEVPRNIAIVQKALAVLNQGGSQQLYFEIHHELAERFKESFFPAGHEVKNHSAARKKLFSLLTYAWARSESCPSLVAAGEAKTGAATKLAALWQFAEHANSLNAWEFVYLVHNLEKCKGTDSRATRELSESKDESREQFLSALTKANKSGGVFSQYEGHSNRLRTNSDEVAVLCEAIGKVTETLTQDLWYDTCSRINRVLDESLLWKSPNEYLIIVKGIVDTYLTKAQEKMKQPDIKKKK